jgi:hypothetical protein
LRLRRAKKKNKEKFFVMSQNFSVSDFDADELNQGIDDTNFPHVLHSKEMENGQNGQNGHDKVVSLPMPVVKKNGNFTKSYSDDVFDVPGTPKTPRSIPTPGNHCELRTFFIILAHFANAYTKYRRIGVMGQFQTHYITLHNINKTSKNNLLLITNGV